MSPRTNIKSSPWKKQGLPKIKNKGGKRARKNSALGKKRTQKKRKEERPLYYPKKLALDSYMNVYISYDHKNPFNWPFMTNTDNVR